MAATGSPLAQSAQVVAKSGDNPARVSQSAVLAAFVGPATPHGEVSQIPVAVGRSAQSVAHVQHMPVLVAYGTGIREDNTQRAWTLELDGHIFYVLALGT